MTTCLYHNDADGQLSAAIVFSIHPETRFFEVGYNSKIPFEEIELNEQVIIVDFSLQKDGDWTELFLKTEDVIWIDHHHTAIDRFDELFPGNHVAGVRDITKSGALLTWEYFYRDWPIPEVVDLVNRWDTWTHNGDDKVISFIKSLEIHNTDPKNELWQTLLFESEGERVSFLSYLQDVGIIVSDYFSKLCRVQIRSNAYEVNFEGYKCLACNTGQLRANFFDSACGYFVYIMYVYSKGEFVVRLQTDEKDIDVGKIATKYGGGGHKGVAGFRCETLPWEEIS